MNINKLSDSNYNTPAFKMLKKSALTSDVQWFAVERFKPPLEKKEISSIADLRLWFKKMFDKEYEDASKKGPGLEKQIRPWKEGFAKFEGAHPDTWIWQAAAFHELIKEKHIVLFDPEAIIDTVNVIKDRLSRGRTMFNFLHEYTKVLREKGLQKYFPEDAERTGWIKFQQSDDPKKNQETIDDIRRLSCGTNWCTRDSFFAGLTIDGKGNNFYIYYEKGYPKIGLRTETFYRPAMSYGGKTIPAKTTEGSMEIKDKWNRPHIDIFQNELKEWEEKYPGVSVYQEDISMLGDGE